MNQHHPEFSADNLPPLADFLCFATYGANLAFNRAYKPYLAELGLTYTQWITLLALAEEDGLTVNQLGKKLFLASNTLTPLLKGLEKQGLLTRTRSQSDERQVQIHLTEQGRALRDASSRCFAVFDSMGLTMDEAVALQKAVAKLRDNLLAGVEKKE
ncbi:MarR family winged helix-turn-helix transcriptional regulator [Testudinibacter sp. TR-2022]|uniref:MarR family winged helix-turn-helix transcriptional regulator n=1 Tax=Testudinibacter sp. TR-2022 TaxID=2585029 RepID=UPI00111A5F97|nr:MarR family transcriptional regulator [Testudinibacter sp. TR-2022]TNH06790.1 MarR family transcriptional regulator [Pasteurellaceae bacterium Phil11]TNH24120.1 MarR family transcriptional regulator [Testudinibacter sp. TR-2022]TNH27589.1 MarR family transcriptional regulator [Testudinibacter sp. TR-2022]